MGTDAPVDQIKGTSVWAAGLTGATAATRYVGGTASGAPTAGTFAVGDFVIDQTGMIYVCTVAGTPGTWVAVTATHEAAADPHAGYRLESAALKISHIIPFVGLAAAAAVETLLPLPGVCTGEAGEHGTFAALRGKAICGTAGTGTNTIVIEADDNPAFSTAVTLFTLNLGTSTEVDDTTLDTAWAAGDNFVRARMTAVGATAPQNLAVFFYFSEEVF